MVIPTPSPELYKEEIPSQQLNTILIEPRIPAPNPNLPDVNYASLMLSTAEIGAVAGAIFEVAQGYRACFSALPAGPF